ncbi:MAG: 3-hydroxyacyl-ACP dehydratase FabZ [Pseudomonadota bacterium]|nr:3-hydroxyacyl-ACP dehydratase FabZ [Pseudomonadota bacterium]MEC7558391.1 3-hydroxyacyl-ACP dehydratase FabZ [Pseudomonadota bacterium]MEC7615268.1 3-hydroxyacyl-ACP dehydratase FabZ [Pseudomonadota bacterium]MEC7852181.1 3-hydroxyacyl-ACP dehydratase FabZ [Pseudomonadota bacterium]MEC8089396.1 3-hydroxyacyl-ACP dehydratase FabZ [Pseudomonadota bacterium]
MSDPITELDIDQIQRRIPHRPPMLLIDRVEDIVPDTSAVGVKMVSVNEPFFAGHFPDYPIMPGVLIVEAMAQTAACMVSVTLGGDTDDKLVFFTTIDKVRFRKPVRPGAVLKLHIEKRGAKGPLWKFSGHATVDGVKTSEAEFAAMIVDPQR